MSSIKEKLKQIKDVEPKRLETLVTLLIIIFVGTFGYGVGKLTTLPKSTDAHVRIEQVSLFQQANTASVLVGAPSGETEQGEVVGSRNSDKYHYPWCSGAKRISDANRVWFKTIEEAKQAGYKPAGNCPGLE